MKTNREITRAGDEDERGDEGMRGGWAVSQWPIRRQEPDRGKGKIAQLSDGGDNTSASKIRLCLPQVELKGEGGSEMWGSTGGWGDWIFRCLSSELDGVRLGFCNGGSQVVSDVVWWLMAKKLWRSLGLLLFWQRVQRILLKRSNNTHTHRHTPSWESSGWIWQCYVELTRMWPSNASWLYRESPSSFAEL